MDICGNSDYKDGSDFSENLLIRLWTHWCLKALGTMSFIFIFFSIYLYLLKNPCFSPTCMPLTAADGWIGFEPVTLYFYLSLWLYVSLVPALMRSKHELIRYGIYIGLLCMAGIAIYIVFPTTVPPNAIEWSKYPEFAMLKGIDTAGNAFPSLHVATAFFSALWLDRDLRQMHAHRVILWTNGLWCLGIVYSTMAIKQHVFLDVVGGLILGGLFALMSLRYHRNRFESFDAP